MCVEAGFSQIRSTIQSLGIVAGYITRGSGGTACDRFLWSIEIELTIRILLFAIVRSSAFNIIISSIALFCMWSCMCSTHGVVYQGLG